MLYGIGSAGAPNALFAATDPERVRAIVWSQPSAANAPSPDYPWGYSPQEMELDERALQHWGTLEGARAWAQLEALYGAIATEEEMRLAARRYRHTASPDVARELRRIWFETDIRPVLPLVKVPTLLFVRETSPREVEEAEYIASLMPLAQMEVLPGRDWASPTVYSAMLGAYERFLGVELPRTDSDAFLATVLFTDIISSTERRAALGDHAWNDLARRHHAVVRDALVRWRGIEVDTAGDGFYATFDGPARAIRCALDLTGGFGSSGSRSARGCTRANAKSSTANALASQW